MNNAVINEAITMWSFSKLSKTGCHLNFTVYYNFNQCNKKESFFQNLLFTVVAAITFSLQIRPKVHHTLTLLFIKYGSLRYKYYYL